MLVGDTMRLKFVIFITIAFLVADSLQKNDAAQELLPSLILQNKLKNDSSTEVPRLLNSSMILDARNATNSTQSPSEQDSSSNLELLHILKQRLKFYFSEKQSFLSSVLIILLATVSVVSYFMLVSWRRHLQKTYGNRECLVQNEVLNERNSPYL